MNFCPNCGTKLSSKIIDNSSVKTCNSCGYIDWENWQDIADKMFYSKATIRRWHDLAIAEIKVPEKLSTDEQL